MMAALLGAGPFRGDIYINGQKSEGVRNLNFENVNVRIDGKGNVIIDAPNYIIKREVRESPRLTQSALTKQYYLVTKQDIPGIVEFDVDVYLNGKFLATLLGSEVSTVIDLTKDLNPGMNALVLRARKNLAKPGEPKSTSRAYTFQVVIGEGNANATNVVIERPLITFVRNASEMGDVSEEYSLVAR